MGGVSDGGGARRDGHDGGCNELVDSAVKGGSPHKNNKEVNDGF